MGPYQEFMDEHVKSRGHKKKLQRIRDKEEQERLEALAKEHLQSSVQEILEGP